MKRNGLGKIAIKSAEKSGLNTLKANQPVAHHLGTEACVLYMTLPPFGMP
jgi:hypothetical protein